MTRTLDVYLGTDLAGRLLQDDHGRLHFEYDGSWLNNPATVALSHSLPLQKQRFGEKRCRGFFGGILPEESNRLQIAKNLGISPRNDYAMLDRIGGECTGAVTFIPEGQSIPGTQHQYRQLSDASLARTLRELPRRPLMAGEPGVRMSLAGAQDKLAVRVDGNKISLPLRDAPSTHILKPATDRFAGVVFNEAACMKLASAVGIPTAGVELRQVEDIDYLLVQRFDRRLQTTAEGHEIERVHQEDFCQALGISSESKYQQEGGPRLGQCVALLREVSRTPVIDLRSLLDAVIFNALIGNHDAHGKNFSLVYGNTTTQPRPDIRLAPLYDLVSTVFYPELTKNMAMKIGGEYRSNGLTKRHFERFAQEAGLAKPFVIQRVRELAQTCLGELTKLDIENQIANEVKALIAQRCNRFERTFSA